MSYLSRIVFIAPADLSVDAETGTLMQHASCVLDVLDPCKNQRVPPSFAVAAAAAGAFGCLMYSGK